MNQGVISRRDFDPVHTNDFGVNHESEGVDDVTLKGRNNATKQFLVGTLGFFEDACGRVRQGRTRNCESTYLEPWEHIPN